jgi:hypothetical protein
LINVALIAQREEEERVGEEMQTARGEMIRKKEHSASRTMGTVNVTQLNSEQMRNVKQGLRNFFANKTIQLLTKFKPEPGFWETWQTFEGAYEESLPASNRRGRRKRRQ